MKNRSYPANQFTGRHMLAIMLAFFGVIIGVNVTMAVMANTSWSGFVVKNSYIASQEFNRRAAEGREQAALGWRSEISLREGTLRYTLVDPSGSARPLSGGKGIIRRAVNDTGDHTLVLRHTDGDAIAAPLLLEDGIWIVEILAEAGLERPYRETRRVMVRHGSFQ
jgi:nitrogen fixation protein FixH